MKLTIVIAAFNVENYLTNLLNSLDGITHLKNIEVIFINDASTDCTGFIIDKYIKQCNGNVRLITHDKNRGLSESRNTGLLHANGEWIHFIDADDYFDAKKYIDLIGIIDEGKDIVFLGYDSVDDTGRPLKRGISCRYVNKKIDSKDLLPMLAIGKVNNYAWSYISKTYIWRENCITFPENMLFEDVATLYKLALSVREVSFSDLMVMHYVQRQTSITHVPNLSQVFDLQKISNEIFSVTAIDKQIRNLWVFNLLVMQYQLVILSNKYGVNSQMEGLKRKLHSQIVKETTQNLPHILRIKKFLISINLYQWIYCLVFRLRR